MECEVAREALSARIDGERESVPVARVDEHVAGCRECQDWFRFVDDQAHHLPGTGGPIVDQTLLILGRVAPSSRSERLMRWCRFKGVYAALVVVGVLQVGIAVAQMAGLHFGMIHSGPMTMTSGDHLMNESTAWSMALGAATIAAVRWRSLVPGLAVVLGVFVVVLFGYVVHDAVAADVTLSRGVSHLPVFAAFICAVIAQRSASAAPHSPPRSGIDDGSANSNSRTGLRSSDNSAA